MKRKIIYFLLIVTTVIAAILSGTAGKTASAAADISVSAKSAYLIDYDSGTVIYSYNENDRLPIASMTKIMTALLAIEAVDNGVVSYDADITVSANAAGMGGSQVFLDANSIHSFENLLKCVIVASANDASVAIAETIAGNEMSFVSLMNSRAKELGLENTNFANCTGLPAVNAYSSAKDVSFMLKELIKHDKYFEFSKIWLEDYTHPDGRVTSITNTNKLVRFYNGCDAGKTGFTSEALFCLSASAKRGEMRLIATVVGEQNGKTRFSDVSNMLNYAFNGYENTVLAAKGVAMDKEIELTKGKNATLKLSPATNISAFTKKGDKADIEVIYNVPSTIKAPIRKGDKVGTASVVKDGVVVSEIDIVAFEDGLRATYWDSIKQITGNW